MSESMQEIRASFFVECEELMEALHDGLQAMDAGEADDETINTVFRAVHSIKGGAGAFGLDQLVGFAHVFETALDGVRNGTLADAPDLTALFFQCADLLFDLVRAARDGGDVDLARLAPVQAQLDGLVPEPDAVGQDDAAVDFQPTTLSLDLPGLPPLPAPADDGDLTRFHIVFAPEPELFASGNEPLFLLRALADLGKTTIRCDHDGLPDLAQYDVGQGLLRWEITLDTNVDEATVREVFEFVEGLCQLTISAGDAGDDDPGPRARQSDGGDVGDAARTATASPVAGVATGAGPVSVPDSSKTTLAPKATVRVDLERIDRLVNLVGELVINQAMLSQSVARAQLANNSHIASGLDEFQQLTRDIQDSVMMIRAQPVKTLFQRMARIVRESATDIGKSVRLKTEGDMTEIDKTVIERLADPLTHMIRNAVDHGLEATADRVAAGKSAEGRITLSAAHRSGRVVIEIADDGAGIDGPRVRKKAEDQGLIAPDHVLSDAEVDALLFLPGFSTASAVSNLSGRGVGMDVVKTAISALGGRITIASERGRGTTFSISLPLTLAVLDGMVVRVAGETLVLPLNAISETLSLRAGDNRALGPNTQVIQVRDSFVPLIDLGTELGYGRPRASYDGAIVLIVAQEDGSRAALVVDAIEDQRQVVIKGMQDSYGRVPGVAAATILGDGQIALILDPADILANASGRSRPEPALAAIA